MGRRLGSRGHSPIRDQSLLDALESLPQRPFAGTTWRSVGQGRDPLHCWRSGGRWDDGSFDVLYTSLTREAAIAERRFHLYQGQPIPPSRVRYELFELEVSLEAVIEFPTIDSLGALGFDGSTYGQLSYIEKDREYPRSQEIAEACYFLGADGILVPSARDLASQNLIIFCDQDTVIEKTIAREHGPIDWKAVPRT